MGQGRFLIILLLLPLLTSLGSPDYLEGNDSYLEKRKEMISEQIVARGIEDGKVLEAMEKIPRHLFVLDEYLHQAYQDHPLPIGHGQTISQPFIVALMTYLLEVEKDDRVLEIGTGSGYQAAVLSCLSDHVYTMEIIGALAKSAADRLKDLGLGEISVKEGDGYYGWSEEGPFDKIIVTAAAGHVPPELIKQLNRGGRIIIPLGNPYSTQILTLILKDEDGNLDSRQVIPVRFVPFTGQAEQ